MPTLKGTQASFSYVPCFLYLAFSSINVSSFILHCWMSFGQNFYYKIRVGEVTEDKRAINADGRRLDFGW